MSHLLLLTLHSFSCRYALLPIAADFRPSLILVSAGFDAVAGDPLGRCAVSPAAFGHMAAALQALAPVCVLLEGGYNLQVCVCALEKDVGMCSCVNAEVQASCPILMTMPWTFTWKSTACFMHTTVHNPSNCLYDYVSFVFLMYAGHCQCHGECHAFTAGRDTTPTTLPSTLASAAADHAAAAS